MNYRREVDDAWNTLEEMGVCRQTLDIVTNINGYTLATLEDVLYAYAGYRSFEQLESEEA